MTIRSALVLAIAACSGGDPAVDAEVVTAACEVTDTGLVVTAELDVALGVGESLEISIDVEDVSISSFDETWTCGGWTVDDVGCAREDAAAPARETVSVEHVRSFDDPQDPTHITVSAVVVIGSSGLFGEGVELDCTR